MSLALNNDSNDIDVVDGSLYMLRDQDALAQYLKQKLKLFYTEWFLDQTKGVPYHDKILVKNPSGAEIDTIFKDQILNTPGITELESFSIVLDGQTRGMLLTFKARSITGEINFNENLP